MRALTHALAALLTLTAFSAAASTNLNREFFNAVGHNNLPSAQALLKKGAAINATEKPWNLTPLLVAPDMSLDMVRFLLAHGADVNAADREGTTVLMRAVHSGDPRIVKAVLKHHPRLEAQGTWRNTALTYAVVQGNPDMVQALIAAGADVNAERADGMRPLDMAQRRLKIAKRLPPMYGMRDEHAGMSMAAMPMGQMHEVPRAVLVDQSEKVLAFLQQAHARHGSGKMASRDVMQHCKPMGHAM